MTTDSTGAILTDQAKMELRKQLGYCLTCTDIPVQLYEIHRSRLNPLARPTKKILTIDGECIEGKCCKCNRHLSSNNIHYYHNNYASNSNNQKLLDSSASFQRDQTRTTTTATNEWSSGGNILPNSNHSNTSRTITVAATSAAALTRKDNTMMTTPLKTTNIRQPARLLSSSTHRHEPSQIQQINDVSSLQLNLCRRHHPLNNNENGNCSSFDETYEKSLSDHKSPHRHKRHTQHSQQQLGHHRFAKIYAKSDKNNHNASTNMLALPPRSGRSDGSAIIGIVENATLHSSLSDLSIDSFFSTATYGSSKSKQRGTTVRVEENQNRNNSKNSGAKQSWKSKICSLNEKDSCNEDNNNTKAVSHHQEAGFLSLSSASTDSNHLLSSAVRKDDFDNKELETTTARDLRMLLHDLVYDDKCNFGSVEIVSDILMNSMESHRDDTQVQLICLQTVIDLFGTSPNTGTWRNEEIQVVDAIENSQCYATVFVRTSRRGDLQIIKTMQAHTGFVLIQELGWDALTLLAMNETIRQTLAVGSRCNDNDHVTVCEHITTSIRQAKAVQRSSSKQAEDTGSALELPASLIHQTLKLLRVVSVEVEARKYFQQQDLLLSILVPLLNLYRMDGNIQIDGCAVISNIIIDATMRNVFSVPESVIVVLANAILLHRTNHPEVVINAYLAIKNLSYNDANVRTMSRMKIVDPTRKFTTHYQNYDVGTDVIPSLLIDIPTVLQYTSGIDPNSILNTDYLIEEMYMIRAQDDSLEEDIVRKIHEFVSNHTNTFFALQEEICDHHHNMVTATATTDATLKDDWNSTSCIGETIEQLFQHVIDYPWSYRIIQTCLQKLNALSLASKHHQEAMKQSEKIHLIKEFYTEKFLKSPTVMMILNENNAPFNRQPVPEKTNHSSEDKNETKKSDDKDNHCDQRMLMIHEIRKRFGRLFDWTNF